jgi:hypothetical protein
MSDKLVCLVYVSRGRPLDAAALEALADAAQRHNAAHGITGVLLPFEGHFLQALEGRAAAVQPLFERISRDPRHHDVVLLSVDQIEARRFPASSMGVLPVLAGCDALVRRFFTACADAQADCAARAGIELLVQMARCVRPVASERAAA